MFPIKLDGAIVLYYTLQDDYGYSVFPTPIVPPIIYKVFIIHTYKFLFTVPFYRRFRLCITALQATRASGNPIPLKMHERVQRLPPGGSSRRSRVRESALQ